MVVLMLLVLVLPSNANAAFASTNNIDQNDQISNQVSGQNLDNITNKSYESSKVTEKPRKTSDKQAEPANNTNNQAAGYPSNSINQAAGSPSNSINQAAGSTTSTTAVSTTTTFTSSQINDAASRVKTFVDSNKRLPSYVTINNVQVSMPQFLQLLTSNLLNINNGLSTTVTLNTVISPQSTAESITSGNLYKSEYISIAESIQSTIKSTGTAPGYVSSSLGKISYESLIYTFTKILSYQKINNRLPNYVAISAWSGSSSNSNTTNNNSSTTNNSSLAQYLVATTNAPSTSSTIISLANSITSGLTTDYDKAVSIFNWVRDNLSYSYYYNSKKGALGALSSKTANCCDTSHLVVALSRAAGIPARYQHGYCKFSGGWYGHVWAQIYVNGKWYNADAISDSNTLGTINNWSLSSYTLYGTYATLPF
jgi:transglutaminase-like putative cysteine protease